jgi:hypothetical protein
MQFDVVLRIRNGQIADVSVEGNDTTVTAKMVLGALQAGYEAVLSLPMALAPAQRPEQAPSIAPPSQTS